MKVNIEVQNIKVKLVQDKIQRHQVLSQIINQVQIHILLKINNIKILIINKNYSIHKKESKNMN